MDNQSHTTKETESGSALSRSEAILKYCVKHGIPAVDNTEKLQGKTTMMFVHSLPGLIIEPPELTDEAETEMHYLNLKRGR